MSVEIRCRLYQPSNSSFSVPILPKYWSQKPFLLYSFIFPISHFSWLWRTIVIMKHPSKFVSQKYFTNVFGILKGTGIYLKRFDQIKIHILLYFNPFLAHISILYPPPHPTTIETPENLWFTGVLRGYKMGILPKNGLILMMIWEWTCVASGQLTIFCSERTIETLEKSVTYVFC